jgi:hypothetical protein
MDLVQLPTFAVRCRNTSFQIGQQSSMPLFHSKTSLLRTIRCGLVTCVTRTTLWGDSLPTSHLLDFLLYQRRKRDHGLSPRSLLAINGVSRPLRISLLSEYDSAEFDVLFTSVIRRRTNVSHSRRPTLSRTGQLTCQVLLTEFRVGTQKELFEEMNLFFKLSTRVARDGLKTPSTVNHQSILL